MGLRLCGPSLSLAVGEVAISGGTQVAAGTADHFAQAYSALRHDPSVQFNLAPQAPPPTPPAWLKAILEAIGKALEPIGQLIRWIGKLLPDAAYARFILWIVVAAGVAALLWMFYNRVRHGTWRLRAPRPTTPQELNLEDDWEPADALARSWLDEADALAVDGHFAEAIHRLLFRSVEDISRRRPTLVKPALTSCELAAAPGIPKRARELFAAIARLVENSLFGGRAVTEPDWLSARESYSEFALAGAWRA